MKHTQLYAILVAIAMIVCLPSANAQFANAFGKQKKGNTHPVRVYFMAYDMQYPGFSFGPEYDFLFATHEKIECTKGVRYVDKHLSLVPQVGVFKTGVESLAAFITLEIDFKTIYNNGWIFDMFASGGYAQVFGNSQSDLGQSSFEDVVLNSTGGFFPQFGIGTGYDFRRKMDTPLQVNFRLVNATMDMTDFINPGLNIGVTYNL